MRIPREALQRQIEAILTAWGMSEAHAAITSARLTDADIRGIDSHGVTLMPLYHELRGKQQIDFRPDIRVVRDNPVTALVDAGHGLGHVPVDPGDADRRREGEAHGPRRGRGAQLQSLRRGRRRTR